MEYLCSWSRHREWESAGQSNTGQLQLLALPGCVFLGNSLAPLCLRIPHL